MATRKSARQHPVAKIDGVMSDPWTIFVQSKLVELESVKVASDRKWGENRLCTLVDSALREKFWVQNSRVHQAMESKDRVKFDSAVAGMVRAYAALEAWAVSNGVTPASDSIPRIEWQMQNGQVMLIVRTVNEAVAIQRDRQDVSNQHIWSMEEIEALLADSRMQEIIKIKALFPTAKVTMFKPTAEFKLGGETGFDDFENDMKFDDNEVMEKKFDSKQAERFKNGTN